MKHIYLILFITALLGIQFVFYLLKKKFASHQKEKINILLGYYDLITLVILLLGYIAVAVHPYPITLKTYYVIAIAIGLTLAIHFYNKLISMKLIAKYISFSLLFFAVQYFLTVVAGLYLILRYSVVY